MARLHERSHGRSPSQPLLPAHPAVSSVGVHDDRVDSVVHPFRDEQAILQAEAEEGR